MPIRKRRATRDKLVLDNMGQVKAIAVRVHEQLPAHVQLDDLISEGIVGLIDAAQKFDPAMGVSFPTYAKHRIRGAILDSLRSGDWQSRDTRRGTRRLEAAVAELSGALGRHPTEEEICGALGWTAERYREIARMLETTLCSFSSRPAGAEEDLPAPDVAGGQSMRPDVIADQERLAGEMARMLRETLPARYCTVVSLYYFEELTMKEIGARLGINESRVSQIHKSALEKLNTALRLRGFRAAGELLTA